MVSPKNLAKLSLFILIEVISNSKSTDKYTPLMSFSMLSWRLKKFRFTLYVVKTIYGKTKYKSMGSASKLIKALSLFSWKEEQEISLFLIWQATLTLKSCLLHMEKPIHLWAPFPIVKINTLLSFMQECSSQWCLRIDRDLKTTSRWICTMP